jgi:hypothetical protein
MRELGGRSERCFTSGWKKEHLTFRLKGSQAIPACLSDDRMVSRSLRQRPRNFDILSNARLNDNL